MKKYITICLIICNVFIYGCSSESDKSESEELSYYETCFYHIYSIGDNLNKLNSDYYDNVPYPVTADDEINLDGSSYDILTASIDDAKTQIFGENIVIYPEYTEEVNDAVLDSIQDAAIIYFDMLSTYLNQYKESVDYYNNNTYKTNIEYASILDNKFSEAFSDFYDSEMLFSRTIRGFLEVENINEINGDNTTDIYKEIGYSMIELSKLADFTVDSFENFDYTENSINDIQSLLDELVAKHSEEKSAIESIILDPNDDNASKLFTIFDTIYLKNLTVFETSVDQFIKDFHDDLTSKEDMINNYYDISSAYYTVIEMHNAAAALFDIY